MTIDGIPSKIIIIIYVNSDSDFVGEEIMKKKKETWRKPRHAWVRNVLKVLIGPFSYLLYGMRVEKFQAQGDRQYLILFNHQTAFDQFFVGLAFRGPIYYIASEDLFSKGWVSSVIRFLVAPIPIKKQTTDIRAVMNCLKVAKEGGTIAMAPEGNRTFSGRTGYINPAVVPLVKKLGIPVALFRIEGGYGVQPRWSDVIRKGKMRSYVSEVIEPEEVKSLSNEQLMERITKGLAVDEARADGEYRHKQSAQYLERAMYVCPYCGFTTFESHKDTIRCLTCEREIQYLPDKRLQGVGFEFPFAYVGPWYDYQCQYVNEADTLNNLNEPFYRENANLIEVLAYKEKRILQKDAPIELYGDRIVCGEHIFAFDSISAVTVLGRNKVNIYDGDVIYQFKSSDKRFNALKYVNLFYRYKNLTSEEKHEQFLGI